jgi:hypothetical protein
VKPRRPPPKPKRRRGRPTIYTPKLAERIVDRIACGESLRGVCSDPFMPDRVTLTKWARRDRELAAKIEAARRFAVDWIAEEVLEIADGAEVETVNVARLRCTARMWWAARIAPKKYGDRVATEISGTIETREAPAPMPAPVAAEVTRVFAAAEKRLGIASKPGAGKVARAEAILAASKPAMTPEQYEAAFRTRQHEDDK